jgi:hypothetical protein
VLAKQIHPAAKWRWMKSILEKTNPQSEHWPHDLAMPDSDPEPIFKLMHEPEALRLRGWDWLAPFMARVASAATAVEGDLQARLGSRASLVWLVQRYARRSRWLRIAELQSVAARGGPSKLLKDERALTRDAAMYLFDQGLDVAIEQTLGQSRYDIVANAVLVEGKICSERRLPLRAVVDGLRQLHSYAGPLAAEGRAPEPVLLIFCMGGPSPDMPTHHTVGTVDIAIVLVDLAPATERGSRAKARAQVTPDDISRELDQTKPTRKRAPKGSRRPG